MHNAQNGICNNFEGTLAISYESYTLGLHIPVEGVRVDKSLDIKYLFFFKINKKFVLSAFF